MVLLPVLAWLVKMGANVAVSTVAVTVAVAVSSSNFIWFAVAFFTGVVVAGSLITGTFVTRCCSGDILRTGAGAADGTGTGTGATSMGVAVMMGLIRFVIVVIDMTSVSPSINCSVQIIESDVVTGSTVTPGSLTPVSSSLISISNGSHIISSILINDSVNVAVSVAVTVSVSVSVSSTASISVSIASNLFF